MHGQKNIKFSVEINFCVPFVLFNKVNCLYRQCLYSLGRKIAAHTDETVRVFEQRKTRCYVLKYTQKESRWIRSVSTFPATVCTERRIMTVRSAVCA